MGFSEWVLQYLVSFLGIEDIDLLIGIFFLFLMLIRIECKTAISRKFNLICLEIFTVRESHLKELNEVVSKFSLFTMAIHLDTNHLCCTVFKLRSTTFPNKFKSACNSSLRYNVSHIKFYCRCTWEHSKDKPHTLQPVISQSLLLDFIT